MLMLEHARNCWLCNMPKAGSVGDLVKLRTFWPHMPPSLHSRSLESLDQEAVGMILIGGYLAVRLACLSVTSKW